MSSRDERNARAWANYDSWKLASPYDNEDAEVFKSENDDLYSCFEQKIHDYDNYIDEAKKDPSIYLNNTDSDLDDLDDYKEYLFDSDEFWKELHYDQSDALQAFYEKQNDDYESAQEAKGGAMREARRNND